MILTATIWQHLPQGCEIFRVQTSCAQWGWGRCWGSCSDKGNCMGSDSPGYGGSSPGTYWGSRSGTAQTPAPEHKHHLLSVSAGKPGSPQKKTRKITRNVALQWLRHARQYPNYVVCPLQYVGGAVVAIIHGEWSTIYLLLPFFFSNRARPPLHSDPKLIYIPS